MHHRLDIITHPIDKVLLSHNLTTQVVAAIGIVSDPGEATFVGILLIDMLTHFVLVGILDHSTDIGLGMSQDICITAAGEGVEDTSLAQINIGITCYRTKEGTTIHKFALCHFVTAIILLGDTIVIALQVNITAVTGIVGIVIAFEYVVVVLRRFFCWIIFCDSSTCFLQRLTDDASLTATEDLEHIALVQVDSRATPYSGILTIAATKHVERLTQHIHTLLSKDDTRVTLGNGICRFCCLIFSIQTDLLAQLIRHHLVEELFALHQGLVDVDDHIAIDDTTVIATTIDIATRESAGKVSICAFLTNGLAWRGWVNRIILLILTCSVVKLYDIPLQLTIALVIEHVIVIAIFLPSLRLYLQTAQVDNQFVARIIIRGFKHATLIECIQFLRLICICPLFRNKGVVTTAYELVKDDNLFVEVEFYFTQKLHATDIATTEYGTKIGGIGFIVFIVIAAIVLADIEGNTRMDPHGHTIHIGSKNILVCQVYRAEKLFRTSNRTLECPQHSF